MTSVDKVVTNPQNSLAAQAKAKLKDLVARLDLRLEQYFSQELKDVFGPSKKVKDLTAIIWEHIREHNLRPAKRIRGSFIYYGYQLLGGKDKDLILEAAMSIELIHTALLMHDDFMDKDEMRRGHPTSQIYFQELHQKNHWWGNPAHYGEAMAIDAGDVALLAGYEILARSKFPPEIKLEALSRMLRGIVNTGFGQAFDLTLQAEGGGQEQDVFDLHLSKTAIYTYENPLHIGAILAGGKDEDLKLLSDYAIPGGIAFQLQDDILGLFGDPEETGKSDYSDLIQRKITQLVIKAVELATPKQKVRLETIWGKKDLVKEEAEEFRQIITDTGSLDYSRRTATKFAQKAKTATEKMRQKGWDKDASDYLEGIARYMIERQV